MRIVKNDSGTYCTDCKQRNNCICFPNDEMVKLEYREILRESGKATLFLLKKQTLSTGKLIKSGVDIWFPNHLILLHHGFLKKVSVPGKLINKIVN